MGYYDVSTGLVAGTDAEGTSRQPFKGCDREENIKAEIQRKAE